MTRRVVLAVLLGTAMLLVLQSCGRSTTDATAPAGDTATTEPAAATPSSTTSSTTPTTSAPTTAPSSTTAPSTTSSTTSTTAAPFVYTSFSSDVMPILEGSCAQCHTPGGMGSIHWELTEVGDAAPYANLISNLAADRVMPPWPASPMSVSFKGDLSLSDNELAALAAWAERDGEIDVDASTPVAPSNAPKFIEDPDLVLTSNTGAYTGSTDVLDDYRCLILEPDVDEPTWVVGYHFEADQTEVVHHAVVTHAPGSLRATAQQLDDADPGPGYSCYAGSMLERGGGGRTQNLAGWAPGANPMRMPDGYGLLIEPGDFIVVQVHYHFDRSAPADLSRMTFEFASDADVDAAGGELKTLSRERYLGPAEIPCETGDTNPLCDRDAALERVRDLYGPFAAGIPDFMHRQCGTKPADFADMTDGTASSQCDLWVETPGQIMVVTGHLHELGQSFRMTKNPGLDDEVVLLDIPDWDFGWQFGYRPEEEIRLERGDVIRIDCAWGRDRAPYEAVGYILWAEGTGDEMCFSTITTTDD